MDKRNKKTIFLDLDGVLNHFGPDTRFYSIEGITQQLEFSRKNINCFNRLIETAGENAVEIVISSTWRTYFEISIMTSIFRQMKIKGRITGYTPDLFQDISSLARRGDEINRYIKTNNIRNFMVIDDDDEMVHDYIRERFIQTFENEGFNEESLYLALTIFNKKTRGKPRD